MTGDLIKMGKLPTGRERKDWGKKQAWHSHEGTPWP